MSCAAKDAACVKRSRIRAASVWPMALKLETGSEAYAPLALAIIGGLASSIILTIFVVPAAYLLIYQRKEAANVPVVAEEAR